ncbi:DUF4835 family protein [Flavobacterium sp.]|uniref:type IX secretion component PorD family protein n=1 Tax=Flavobacterium sp. TaxID=239 RepID=UPI0039E407F3
MVNAAAGSGYKGWSGSDGNSNRYFLVNDMLSETYKPFRETMYKYHFEGMDSMAKDQKAAKQSIAEALEKLKEVHSVRPNSLMMRVFFDAKADEIVSIFSGGPKMPITDVVDNLNRISPLNAAKWGGIKF